MLSVHQPWDPLEVCVVGRSYPPEFYSWIKNARLRTMFEQIAIETEEDYQNLIDLLLEFGVEVVRPDAPGTVEEGIVTNTGLIPPPVSMNPRDQMVMIGDRFFCYPYKSLFAKKLDSKQRVIYSDSIQSLHSVSNQFPWWTPVLDRVRLAGNPIIDNLEETRLDLIPANGITRVGRDIYFGCNGTEIDQNQLEEIATEFFQDYRCHYIATRGHIDGCFSPVVPGLIISVYNTPSYQSVFPDWEVIYIPGESWSKIGGWEYLKSKNHGKWWIKDHEQDDDLIELVQTWLYDWTGYIEESVFDVNMLTVDPQNVIVSSYNKVAFDALERHGVTPHVCPIRHRYFWDGGIHCITLDLHRRGHLQDHFAFRT